jgi:hypothetical protein
VPTPIYSWLSPSHRPSTPVFDRRVYLFNGWDRGRVWDGIGSSDSAVGIDAPPTWDGSESSRAAGNTTVGTHRVRYRYLDESTGNYSPPSNAVDVVIAGGGDERVIFSLGGAPLMQLSTDPRVTHIILEATDVNGVDFYEADRIHGTIPVAQAVLDIADVNLQEFDLPYPVEVGTIPPPAFRFGIAHRGRMFGAGQVVHVDGTVAATVGGATVTGTGTNWSSFAAVGRKIVFSSHGTEYTITAVASPTSLTIDPVYAGAADATADTYRIYDETNQVFFSEAGYPEVFDPLAQFEALDDQEVRGLSAYSSDLLIFGATTIERFTFNVSPSEGFKRKVPGERGLLGNLCVLSIENLVYAFDRQGVYVYQGDSPIHISRPIDVWLEANINFTQREKFFAVYYPRPRTIRWYVVVFGQTEPKTYVEYDIERKVWSVGELEVALTAGETTRNTVDVHPFTGDENGWTWLDDTGPAGGLGSATPGSVVVAAGASSTVIPLKQGVGAVDNLGGVYVTTRAGNHGVVLSNTATELTLQAPGMPTPPAEDDVLLLGRIRSKLKTRAFFMDQAFRTRKRGVYLWIFFTPQDEGEARVRFYRNLSESPVSSYPAIGAAAGRLLEEGVDAPGEDGSDFVFSLSKGDGVVKIPVGTDPFRVIQAEIEVDTPRSSLSLLGYEFVSAEGRETRA